MGLLNLGGFIGEYRHNLDDKGRLTIPSAWRPKQDSPDNQFLALPSLAGDYVTVYPPKMIAQLEERISQISLGDVAGQRAVRRVMSMAHSFSCDKQGRINLNDKLIAHAHIDKSAVILGQLSTFSIYSEAIYDELMTEESKDDESLADVFQRFGL
ncbi:MAG: mraZ [Verrucomicrobiota bacterium]